MPLAVDIDLTLSSAAEKIAVGIVLFLCTTVLSLLLGRLWGYYQARRQLEVLHFFDTLNVGFNMLDGGTLRIRTVFETSLDHIYRNRILVETLKKLARKTTADNPMIELPKDDAWYYLNFLLNNLLEKFSVGTAREACGLPVTRTRFSLFLTCEKVGADRLHKIRAMLVRQELLEAFPYTDSLPALEKDYHQDRIVTLRCAARAFREKPYLFLHFDISL
jgi:hypothetical protein